MREILFRGKRQDTGEWVFGLPFYGLDMEIDGIEACVSCNDLYTIAPETLGQYTGMKDKHGKRIFEGDIVEAILTRVDGYSEFTSTRTVKGIIWYDLTGMLGLQVDRTGSGEPVWSDFFYELDMSGLILDYSFEVLGNIHDNPELLLRSSGKDFQS